MLLKDYTEEPKSLKLIGRLRPLFEKMNIDYEAMHTILKIKLLMDKRKASTVFNNKNSTQERKGGGEIILNMVISIFLGIMLITLELPIFYKMSTLLGIITLYLTFYMLADFSSVILDVQDEMIIGTKPVSYKTIHMAKIVHISIYLTTIVLSLTFLPLIVSLYQYGVIFSLVFIGEIILMTLFVMIFTSIIYYILLSVLDGERLKDVLNIVQVLFVIFMAVAQQVIPRASLIATVSLNCKFHYWFYAVPSMWMGAPFALLQEEMIDKEYAILGILSLIVPIILFTLYSKYMSPYFEIKLGKLRTEEGRRKNKNKQKVHGKFKLEDWICKEPIQRGTYYFIKQMMKTERNFKLRFYPDIAISMILPWIMIISFGFSRDNTGHFLMNLGANKSYFFMYFSFIICSSSLMYIKYSTSYKAAWLYKAAPDCNPGDIFKGMLKVLIIRYFLPFIFISGIVCTLIYGHKVMLDFIVLSLNMVLFLLSIFKLRPKYIPFSTPSSVKDTSSVAMNMLSMVLLILVGTIHFMVSNKFYLTVLMGIISLGLSTLLWRSIANIRWEDVE